MDEFVKLVLEDGTEYLGKSFGASQNASGEVVFTTGMVGYPETMTDPSYKGQILVLTYPLIGNYGVPENIVIDELSMNLESEKIQVSALAVSDYSAQCSHWNAKMSLAQWLQQNSIPGIYGIDTRSLTKKLRDKGVMLGKIIGKGNIRFYDPNKSNLVSQVSTGKVKIYGKGTTKILLIDCGAKHNIIRSLLKRDVTVIRTPWNHNIFNMNFDGIVISNGPGDPKMCRPAIQNIKKALSHRIPVFGICLGNQILALAAGANTYKLKYGHRSQNQPCTDNKTGRCYITSQNHGYATDTKSLPGGWNEWFFNSNDKTNEGIIHKSGIFRSVQFHPEASPGPLDTGFLFDEFIEVIRQNGR
ncbi:glutamine-hydrolyzing carbamoyl-phosphate synthase small subunit [Candidatus Woesearchaeota archaeon]|nr:glutamine-hydrolyzing carbamoyl-phosphate synthase small subunit [Candidatus Woesearchaeota archaeon]